MMPVWLKSLISPKANVNDHRNELDAADRQALETKRRLAEGVVELDRTKVEVRQHLNAIEAVVKEMRGDA